jgi:hypothetical protein
MTSLPKDLYGRGRFTTLLTSELELDNNAKKLDV